MHQGGGVEVGSSISMNMWPDIIVKFNHWTLSHTNKLLHSKYWKRVYMTRYPTEHNQKGFPLCNCADSLTPHITSLLLASMPVQQEILWEIFFLNVHITCVNRLTQDLHCNQAHERFYWESHTVPAWESGHVSMTTPSQPCVGVRAQKSHTTL